MQLLPSIVTATAAEDASVRVYGPIGEELQKAYLDPLIEHAGKLMFELVLKDALVGPYGRPMP